MVCASTPPRSVSGFTLVECVVGLAIVGILSAIAYPSLAEHVSRSRRTDAIVSIAMAQLAQERFRSNAPRYGSLAEIGIATLSSAGHYTLESSAGVDRYTITATATGTQQRDAACRVLRLHVVGGNAATASGPDAQTANDAATDRACWKR